MTKLTDCEPEVCPACLGIGFNVGMEMCPVCNGTGAVLLPVVKWRLRHPYIHACIVFTLALVFTLGAIVGLMAWLSP